MKEINKNIFGEKLTFCSKNPLTGFFRNGFCNTGKNDQGMHIVCAKVTVKFLNFSKLMGNDLSTPMPEYGFQGLKQDDFWCLCAERWVEALKKDVAPNILLEATHEKILSKVDFNTIKKFGLEFTNLN